jgi:hypothetical protein
MSNFDFIICTVFIFVVNNAFTLKMTNSWDIAPCSLLVDRCFRGAYCLHHQGDDGRQYASLKHRSASTRIYCSISKVVFIFAAVGT